MEEERSIVTVNELSVSFRRHNSSFVQEEIPVLSELSVNVKKGEVLAIAGSSGSGKSILAHAIMGLLPDNAITSGEIWYKDTLLTKKIQQKLCGTSMALIPQSVAYLDPLMRVGEQIQGIYGKKDDVEKALKQYELEERVAQMFPFQLSGGMARKVLVSTAVITAAELIIADEPTPGLDLAMAMETLKFFREFANQGKGVILITHDIDLAFHFADRIAIFYAGTTVEIAKASDFSGNGELLRHPYTRALYKALPQNGFEYSEGLQPYLPPQPSGCRYSPCCPDKQAACAGKIPMREVRGGYVRCVYGN